MFIFGILYLGYSDRPSRTGKSENNVSVESVAVDSDLIASLINGLLSLMGKRKWPTHMVIFEH